MRINISIGWDKSELAPLVKTLPGKDELLPACVCLDDHGTVWTESSPAPQLGLSWLLPPKTPTAAGTNPDWLLYRRAAIPRSCARHSHEDIEYGHVMRWKVNPRIRGDVLASTLHDLRPAFQRLLDGLDYVMAGRCLYLEFNEEAQDADNEIIDTLHAVQNNPSNLVDM